MLRRALVHRIYLLNYNLQSRYVARQTATTKSLEKFTASKGDVIRRIKPKEKAKGRKSTKKSLVENSTLSSTKIKKTSQREIFYNIIQQATKIADNRFEATPAQEVARSAVSFIKNHSFVEKRYNDRELMALKSLASEEHNMYKLLESMSLFNDNLGAKLDTCYFSGEKATKLFHRVERIRNDSKNIRSLTTGAIVYSIPKVFNLLLNALAKEGKSSHSLQVLKWIDEDGFKPNYKSYLYLLESMGRKESPADIVEISQVLKRMSDDNYAIEEMLWHGQFEVADLQSVLRAVLQVSPDFRPIPPSRFMDRSNERDEFPVLQRCLSSEISASNPFQGVQSSEEMMNNFQRQLDLELNNGKSVKPVAIYRPHPKRIRREQLALEFKKEVEMWRRRLNEAFDTLINVEKKRDFHSSLLPLLKVLPRSTYIDIMIQEMNHLLSCGKLEFSPIYLTHQRLGDRVYDAFVLEQRKKYGLVERFRTVYEKYIDVYTAERRNQAAIHLSDVWQDINTSSLNGACLEPISTKWPTSTRRALGKHLFRMMYENIKFDASSMQRHPSGIRDEIPALFEVVTNDGISIREEVKIHPKLQRWVEAAGLLELRFTPNELPMLCPPVPWVRPEIQKSAGYFFSFCPTDLVRRPSSTRNIRRDYEDKLTRKQIYPVLDAINALNAVAWKVNKSVLEVMLRVFRAGGDPQIMRRLGLPVPQSDMPELPSVRGKKMSARERAKSWQMYNMIKKQQAENYSSWADTLYRLSIASEFQDETFWFPQSMDFRGRVYPCSAHFNHMGSDISRSLLVFAKGKPLGPKGLDWLLIHLINLTGLKKRSSIADRLAYAKTILNDIIDSAEEPLTGRGWWRNSEYPWQTLACCMEVLMAMKSPNPEEFISHFPVHQDGSCNGLQHYAALGRDQKGAECVNLINREVPKDVYSDVTEFVEQQRVKDASRGLSIAQKLEGYVERKVIKQSVMTTVYGVTLYGAKLQIVRQLRDIEGFPAEDIQEASTYLGKHTLTSISRFFTASTHIQKWLTSCAQSIATLRGTQVAWRTPMGMYVMQPYIKSLRRDNSYLSNLDVIPDQGKQQRAFPPNFIHSIDSTHMMLTALHCQRVGITFSAVHDCFWTHAADVDQMNIICREQFVALHQQPLIYNMAVDLRDRFAFTENEITKGATSDRVRLTEAEAELFNQKLMALPKIGDFNLNDVLDSTYFFG